MIYAEYQVRENDINDEDIHLRCLMNLPSSSLGLDFLSDKALIGFLKVIIEVNRDIQLLAYRGDERLTMGNGNGFSLRMGFGLHAGWAIEGAVGSLQKVDATYLSPHVNMAARMEVATKQFGVSILLTRSFYKVCYQVYITLHCRICH